MTKGEETSKGKDGEDATEKVGRGNTNRKERVNLVKGGWGA